MLAARIGVRGSVIKVMGSPSRRVAGILGERRKPITSEHLRHPDLRGNNNDDNEKQSA